MIVARMSLVLLGASLACAAPGSSPSPATTPLPRRPMDSAMAHRLCAQPDLVRAGIADCVLKDQSLPAAEIRRLPPAP